MVISIPKRALLARWDVLPEEIRDAMSSDKNIDALDRIYEQLHIPENKQKAVARIAAYVFYGFLHPDDAAKELEAALPPINPQHARELADALKQNVFLPHLSAIDKLYSPYSAPQPSPGMTLDSIRPAPAASGPKPLASFAPTPVAAPLAPPAVKLAPTPVASLNFSAAPSPLPTLGAVPTKPIAASSPAPAAPSPLPTLGAVPSKPLTPSSPAPVVPSPVTKPSPVATPAPAPFMMQAETKVSPIAQAPKFTMESFGKAVSAFGGKTGFFEAPARIAQVEIGKEEVQKPTGVVSKYVEAVTPRTIHYSNLSTPLPGSLGASSSGPVSMGTIQGGPSVPTAPAPRPTVPPGVPSLPISPGSGGFIKTLITPKNEKPDSGLPLPPQK